MEESKVRFREREEKRTEEKKAGKERVDQGGAKCPHCGAPVQEDYEICPVCGWKLVDYCTFCGAPMLPGDMDCPECGMPSDGVMCPACNIRNFRPFCRKCNKPLSRAARRAIDKAKQDPKVQEAARILKKVAELQSELETALSEEGSEPEEPKGPTEGELRLKELMAKVGFTHAEQPRATARKLGRTREEVLAEYKKAVEEANKVMEEMLPPAGMTPQEQRNYYTARKVAVMEIVEERWYGLPVEKTMGWECNKCHVLHTSPEECCVREYGGKWVTCWMNDVVDKDTPGAIEHIDRIEKGIVYKRQ
ncbi:MAG: zinc ribbon domain-containing protein [Bacteroidales bacterium]|nr:zinc ribbon domain-containing protein [Bacteroidales bacterium]